MENHTLRTLLLIDLATVFREANAAQDKPARVEQIEELAALQKRLDALRRDTRMIADEMDRLAYGTATQLIWEGTGTEKLAVAASSDTTGYHKALASLDSFSRQLAGLLRKAKP